MLGKHPIPVLLVMGVLFLATFLPVRSQLGATFGEPCGEDSLCDPRALLSCISGKCGCIKPKEMTFDMDKRKCVVLSGKKCAYSGEETLECVKKAVCAADGHCQCTSDGKSEYYGNTEGLCLAKGVPGENCTIDGECRQDIFLTCEKGVCSCNLETSIFDRESNKCRMLVGRNCSANLNHCVNRAHCIRASHNERDGSICRCLAHSSMESKSSGLCLEGHNHDCDGEHPCHEEFACVDGTCQCHFPTHQRYSSTLLKCESLAHGPCLENVDGSVHSFPCVANASCQNSTGVSECICSKGWIPSSERYCQPAHGQPCRNKLIRHIRRYSNSSAYVCDPAGELVCRNEKCSCPDMQVYDEHNLKCRGLVGARCATGGDGFCIDGAFCKQFRGDKFYGSCQCYGSKTATAERKCATLDNDIKSKLGSG